MYVFFFVCMSECYMCKRLSMGADETEFENKTHILQN